VSVIEDTIIAFGKEPWTAHQALFAHRHHDLTPQFHGEIIQLWHSSLPSIMLMAFRGAGKSTLSEEAIIVGACLRDFHNGIILGSSYERACERLAAVKHEFETNPFIEQLFGNMVGHTWNEGKIVLANGVVLSAFGRGQSLRGSKHLDRRPDCCFADDVEEQEDVDTPEARAKMLRWFMKVVTPALDPHARIRMAATPLHPESLAMVLSQSKGWLTRTYPAITLDSIGARQAAWPARFPLADVDELETRFRNLGLLTEFRQEYMCEASAEEDRVFVKDYFRVEPQVRTWHAVYGFYDPARTVKVTSATTGWCYFSWVNNRLIVWDAGADFFKPDELVDHIFKKDLQYNPVEVGVERDGLEEFLLQPLRHEMVKRSRFINIVPYKAPVGKLQFIKSLQLFFKAKEIIFDRHFPELEAQLLGFPQGRIDAPNALAYALRMRPGKVIYENFSVTNIVGVELNPRLPVWLAINATSGWTTGVLLQSVDGALHVLADYVRESDPTTGLPEVLADASLEAGRGFRIVAGPNHFTGHDRVGLRAAANRLPVVLRRGGPGLVGRQELNRLMKLQSRGQPSFRVCPDAHWTLNALAGGYSRPALATGAFSEFAKESPHKVLMEGLESFCGLLGAGLAGDEDDERRYAVDSTGRRYLTARG
jgi:hypothetical protein